MTRFRFRSIHLGIFISAFAMMGQAGCPALDCPNGNTCLFLPNILATGSTYTEGCDLDPGGLAGDQYNVGRYQGVVGYDHFTRGERLGAPGNCDKVVYYYRTGVSFDPTVLRNFVNQSGLIQATLHFLVPYSSFTRYPGEVPRPFPFAFSCIAHLGFAQSAWTGDWDPSSPIPFTSAVDVPFRQSAPFNNGIVKISQDSSVRGVIVDIDVTRIVRNWALGEISNFGFVLSGNNESSSPDEETCESWVEQFKLILLPFRTSGEINNKSNENFLIMDGRVKEIELSDVDTILKILNERKVNACIVSTKVLDWL